MLAVQRPTDKKYWHESELFSFNDKYTVQLVGDHDDITNQNSELITRFKQVIKDANNQLENPSIVNKEQFNKAYEQYRDIASKCKYCIKVVFIKTELKNQPTNTNAKQ